MADVVPYTPPKHDYNGLIKEVNHKISQAVNLLCSAHETLDFIDEQTDWDMMIICDLNEALVRLAYCMATFNTWDDE